jgi:hypothetical protein
VPFRVACPINPILSLLILMIPGFLACISDTAALPTGLAWYRILCGNDLGVFFGNILHSVGWYCLFLHTSICFPSIYESSPSRGPRSPQPLILSLRILCQKHRGCSGTPSVRMLDSGSFELAQRLERAGMITLFWRKIEC